MNGRCAGTRVASFPRPSLNTPLTIPRHAHPWSESPCPRQRTCLHSWTTRHLNNGRRSDSDVPRSRLRATSLCRVSPACVRPVRRRALLLRVLTLRLPARSGRSPAVALWRPPAFDSPHFTHLGRPTLLSPRAQQAHSQARAPRDLVRSVPGRAPPPGLVAHLASLCRLNGGPGCSSFDGALIELGPIKVNKDGATLRLVESTAWNEYANVLFRACSSSRTSRLHPTLTALSPPRSRSASRHGLLLRAHDAL